MKILWCCCGDKGISVGENSLLDAVSVDIRNAVIGVSSKDFSRVHIVELSGDQVDVCADKLNDTLEVPNSPMMLIGKTSETFQNGNCPRQGKGTNTSE